MMPGAEYLTTAVLLSLWAETGTAFAAELAEAKTTVQDFLKRLNPAWNVVGRVHFNLAENRKDEQAPFAFLATYTDRLSAHGKAQHLPARPGAARVRRRGQQGAPAVAAAPGPARGRALRLAQADGRRGRDLPPAALVAAGGLPLSRRRPGAGARRRRRAHARDLESRAARRGRR